MSERRRAPRHAAQLRLWCDGANFTVLGRTVDASSTGLFLSTMLPMRPGQRVRLRCPAPCFSARAEVRFMRLQGKIPGAGLRIVHVVEGHDAYLNWLAEQVPAPGPAAWPDSGLAVASTSVILSGEPAK